MIDHEKDDVRSVRYVPKALSIDGDSFFLRLQSFHRSLQAEARTGSATVVLRRRTLINQDLIA